MVRAMKGWVMVAAGRSPNELAAPKSALDIGAWRGLGPTRVAEVRKEKNWAVLPRVWLRLGEAPKDFPTATAVVDMGRGNLGGLPRSARLRLEGKNRKN
jgi:hypothetical protein